MKLHIITLLFAALLNLAIGIPTNLTDLPVNESTEADLIALIDYSKTAQDSLTVNGTTAFSTDMLARDPATGTCHIKLGLVEHFPRGGSTGGRQASVFISALLDGDNKDIWWRWDSGESGYPNGRHTERRIDNWTIRIYDLIHRGDSLAFTWAHPDNSRPDDEWMNFNYNGKRWNDRGATSDCHGSGYCCKKGPFYDDGKDRMLRAIGCAFLCP